MEMRVAARPSFLGIGCHIAQGGMIGHTGRHARVEASRDEREGSALAASLHKDIAAVPFGERAEIVEGAYASHVDVLHVVVVAVVEAVLQVAVLAREGAGYLLELLLGHLGVESVNLHL